MRWTGDVGAQDAVLVPDDAEEEICSRLEKPTSSAWPSAGSMECSPGLKPLFAEQDDVEVFYGIFLDAANHVLTIEKLSSGTLSSSPIYPREIVKKVLARQNLVKPANDMTEWDLPEREPGMPSRPESAGGRRTSRKPW